MLRQLFVTLIAVASTCMTAQAACTTASIAGTWQFVGGVTCPVTISTTGAVTTTGSCLANPPILVCQPPLATLSVDTSCKVTGSLSTGVSNGPDCSQSTTITHTLSLWLSGDGTRITGYGVRSATTPATWQYFEFISHTGGGTSIPSRGRP